MRDTVVTWSESGLMLSKISSGNEESGKFLYVPSVVADIQHMHDDK